MLPDTKISAALETALHLANIDVAFREKCLKSPRKALQSIYKGVIAKDFRFKFLEKDGQFYWEVMPPKSKTPQVVMPVQEPANDSQKKYFNIFLDWGNST